MEISTQRRAGALLLVAVWVSVFTIALGLRTANAPVALRDGLPVLLPTDDLYHAKRILHTVENYPSMLRFDPDRNVTGAWCPWPPLWDFSVATPLRALGLHGIDALAFAAWLAPMLASVFAATLAAAIARKYGAPAGLVTGLGIAVPIPLVFSGQLARLDHQVIEGPLMVAIALAVALLVREHEDRTSAGRVFLLASALGAAIFVQTALILGIAMALGVILLFSSCRARLFEGSAAFALTAIAIYAYRLTLPDDYPFSPWYLGSPHALLLAAGAVAIALATLPALFRLKPAPRAVAALVPPAALLLAIPALRNGLLEGSGFLGGDRWFSTIAEFRPYFDDPATRWLDALVLAPQIAGVILAVVSWRRGEKGRLAIALMTVAYGLLALSSRRFVYVAAPLAALAGALAFDTMTRLGRRGAAVAVAALVVAAPALATFVYLPSMTRPLSLRTQASIRAAVELRKQSAKGRVLAPWDCGHLIGFYSGLPAVVDNFGSVGRPGELQAAAAALLATDDATLARYCRERGIAYIILNHPIEQLAATASIAGFDGESYARGIEWIEPGPAAGSTFWWRAYFGDGRAALAGVAQPKPIAGFRLVWADEMDVAYAFGLRGDAAQIWAVE